MVNCVPFGVINGVLIYLSLACFLVCSLWQKIRLLQSVKLGFFGPNGRNMIGNQVDEY